MTVKDLKTSLDSYPDSMPVGVWESNRFIPCEPRVLRYVGTGQEVLCLDAIRDEAAVRDQSIRIRVSAAEKEQIESKAAESGVSVGAYLRGLGL